VWIWDLGFPEFFSHTRITGDSTTNKTVGLVATSDRFNRSSDCCLHMDVTLQLHFFGVVPLYSLVVNILATP